MTLKWKNVKIILNEIQEFNTIIVINYEIIANKNHLPVSKLVQFPGQYPHLKKEVLLDDLENV